MGTFRSAVLGIRKWNRKCDESKKKEDKDCPPAMHDFSLDEIGLEVEGLTKQFADHFYFTAIADTSIRALLTRATA
jgi:hypothetical protein